MWKLHACIYLYTHIYARRSRITAWETALISHLCFPHQSAFPSLLLSISSWYKIRYIIPFITFPPNTSAWVRKRKSQTRRLHFNCTLCISIGSTPVAIWCYTPLYSVIVSMQVFPYSLSHMWFTQQCLSLLSQQVLFCKWVWKCQVNILPFTLASKQKDFSS